MSSLSVDGARKRRDVEGGWKYADCVRDRLMLPPNRLVELKLIPSGAGSRVREAGPAASPLVVVLDYRSQHQRGKIRSVHA